MPSGGDSSFTGDLIWHALPIRDGLRMLGPWPLERPIGHGAFATVYRGRHAKLTDRAVAVKCLDPHRAACDPALVKRFHREASAALEVTHPNVVRVYHVDEATLESGLTLHFLVMEFVAGEDAMDLVKRVGPLEPLEAARIACEAARGLGAAHARGLVHRDVKPANLMIAESGAVKVADLGLARPFATEDLQSLGLTESSIVGTAAFMAPEQTREPSKVEPRADVYSLGATLYCLLTGEVPFRGSFHEIVIAKQDAPFPDVLARRKEVPRALAAILSRATSSDPARRQRDGQQLQEELAAFLAAHGRHASTGPRPDAPTVDDPRHVGGIARHVVLAATPPDGAEAQAAGRGRASGRAWKIRDEATGVVFVLVEPGRFHRGSPSGEIGRHVDEGPVREAEIREPFYLAETPVTVGQWRRLMGDGPGARGEDSRAVVSVSWRECRAFLERAGAGWRLPLEEEWEYACRAGTRTPWSTGTELRPDQGSVGGDAESPDLVVGRFPPNPWGFRDLHGLVWEWCADVYEDGQLAGRDEAEADRVVRGGSWDVDPIFARSARRHGLAETARSRFVGFRPVLDAIDDPIHATGGRAGHVGSMGGVQGERSG